MAAHQGEDRFLDRGDDDAVPASIAERLGTIIGPYKLLEQIGEGGMGVVFMAEQTQPVQGKVALKIVKPGMDTKQVLARFDAERQALALMDHPNIARVLDAGTTDLAGRTCDGTGARRADHRVLRSAQTHDPRAPGTVYQCLPGSAACPSKGNHPPRSQTDQRAGGHGRWQTIAQVIDFGVAKATGQKLTEKTLFTGLTQMIGTPLYMSPEQAEMSGQDVDTRSDIYSLGVLLYELLTGTTPFDSQR